MENDIKIDYEEYEKQRRELILQEGKYCRAEILLARDDYMPLINLELKAVKSDDVAKLCLSLEKLLE